MHGGYAGRILYVDLSSREVESRPLDEATAAAYLGGSGLGARLYFDLLADTWAGGADPRLFPDPLSADNPVVIMTGPLTGLHLSAVARWTVASRSPQTGYFGDANVGGFFGAELKAAGFDGAVMIGAASEPVYLHVEAGQAEVRDASAYWGLDTYETNDRLIADLRAEASVNKPGQVVAIGPAGERLVRFASLVHRKGHIAGRTGLGAVFGAKKLKAVFCRGSGRVPVAAPEHLAALKRELAEVYEESISVEGLRAFGTASHMDIGVILGDIPMRNWALSDWELFDDLGPLAYQEKLGSGRRTCFACGVSCKREAEVAEGPFRFERGPGPEYETVATFGTMCLNPDLEAVGKANDLCNRLGMDTISCGSTIAFALDCFEHGLLGPENTGGLELGWGDGLGIAQLTEMIGRREGFGDVLAEGSERAAERIGAAANTLLSTVKSLEAPMHDPRSAHGYGLAYAVSPRGACHMAGVEFPVESGGMFLEDIPELSAEFEGMTSDGKAALNVAAQDYGMFFSSCAGFCNLGAMVLSATQAVGLVTSVTGRNMSIEDAMAIGRRVWLLKRSLTNLFGARSADDRLPTKLLTPLTEGPTEGSSPDMDLMLGEFYELRGLNADGTPTVKTLLGAGLADVAAILHGGQADS